MSARTRNSSIATTRRGGGGGSCRAGGRGRAPRRPIGQPELGERGLTPAQDRGDPVERAGGGPGVQVGEQCLRVGQVRQAREGGAALVVDEDETHARRANSSERSRPAIRGSFRLARARATGDEGVRAVRDEVEASRVLRRVARRRRRASQCRWAHLGSQSTRWGARLHGRSAHGPPPARRDRPLIGDAHAGAPRGQLGDAARVADVKHAGGALLRAARRAVGTVLPVLTWMSTAAVSHQDGGVRSPPDARPAHCAATCPAHHSAHSAPYSPTMPIDEASPCCGLETWHAEVTRRPSLVARPGQTAALGTRVGAVTRSRQRGKDEGEGRSVPASSAHERAPNHPDHADAHEHAQGGTQRPPQRRGHRDRAQTPGHERDHDGHGNQRRPA